MQDHEECPGCDTQPVIVSEYREDSRQGYICSCGSYVLDGEVVAMDPIGTAYHDARQS